MEESTRFITIQVKPELRQAIEDIAIKENRNISAQVRHMAVTYIENAEGKGDESFS